MTGQPGHCNTSRSHAVFFCQLFTFTVKLCIFLQITQERPLEKALLEGGPGLNGDIVQTAVFQGAAGAVNADCEVCQNDRTKCEGKEVKETEPPAATEPEEESANPMGLIALAVVVVLAVGGAIYYFKVVRGKNAVKGDTELDEINLDDEFDTEIVELDDLDDEDEESGGEKE